ncbi:MAG: DUF1045 domain-containing protein [Rhizobacter sp.]
MPRHAVYWAPAPEHPLWDAGCRWLGRDPARPDAPLPPRDGVDEPRRYGFHATLKPPMALREGATDEAFLAAVDALAARLSRFAMPPLQVAWLGDFIALRPLPRIDASHPLRRLADVCVSELDAWRAPPAEDDLRRRIDKGRLDPSQQALLRRWGYPHVFEHWRFHMSLTGSLPDDAALRDRWFTEATRHFAPALAVPLEADAVCVFTEPAPGAPFVLTRRCVLGP